MPARAPLGLFHRMSLPFVLAATACGGNIGADAHQREIAWTYGPTRGGATAEHVQGTGGKGGPPLAKGWRCRLQDGKRLVIEPHQLAPSHALFGKVTMSFGLFDQAGRQLHSVRSPVITAGNASFTFELGETVAKDLWDVVIWYCAV